MHREAKLDWNSAVILDSGYESRFAQYSNGLLIATGSDTFHHGDLGRRPIWLNDEPKIDASFNTGLFSDLWVLQIVNKPF